MSHSTSINKPQGHQLAQGSFIYSHINVSTNRDIRAIWPGFGVVVIVLPHLKHIQTRLLSFICTEPHLWYVMYSPVDNHFVIGLQFVGSLLNWFLFGTLIVQVCKLYVHIHSTSHEISEIVQTYTQYHI